LSQLASPQWDPSPLTLWTRTQAHVLLLFIPTAPQNLTSHEQEGFWKVSPSLTTHINPVFSPFDIGPPPPRQTALSDVVLPPREYIPQMALLHSWKKKNLLVDPQLGALVFEDSNSPMSFSSGVLGVEGAPIPSYPSNPSLSVSQVKQFSFRRDLRMSI